MGETGKQISDDELESAIAAGKPAAQPALPGMTAPSGEAETTPLAEPETRKGNPAKKAGLLLAAMAMLLVGWYAVSDRIAPFSSRGTVSAYVAQIAPRVSGQVTEVFVEDNAIVEGGTPLFQLDKRPFELAVRQAEAALAQAMQATDASAAAITSSQARVTQARANLENAQASASRARSLVERGVMARASLDDAEAVLRVAIAEEDAATADLESALLQLGPDGGASSPQILSAQLQLEQAQLDLLYSTVVAPTRGVVTNLQLAIGQYAAAGSPVMTFIDARGGWITVDLRENQIGNVDSGDQVGLLFDAMPGQIFTGLVHSVAWGIDPGRTSAGGLMQNAPENEWFEPARRMPVHIELDGGMEHWPQRVKAGAKVSAVVYAGGTGNPIAWVAGGILRLQSWLTYLY